MSSAGLVGRCEHDELRMRTESATRGESDWDDVSDTLAFVLLPLFGLLLRWRLELVCGHHFKNGYREIYVIHFSGAVTPWNSPGTA